MADTIDWTLLRKRIAQTEVVLPERKRTRKDRTLEELEEYRRKERERNKDYRERNPDKVHEREKRWRHDNPDKVRAKKKRFYDAHKGDPVWMEEHRRRNREYKLRKRLEKLNNVA